MTRKKGEMMSSVLNGTDFKDVNTSISNEDKLAIMHAKQQGDKKRQVAREQRQRS